MSATLALRKSIEAAIVADYAVGGLRERAGGLIGGALNPDGAAYVQGDKGAYYERAPANDPKPRIVYSITEQASDATNYQVISLRVSFQIEVQQDQNATGAGGVGDFGYTTIDAIRDRLITVFGNVTMTAQDSWTFSPLQYQARRTGDSGGEGRQYRTDGETFTCIASKTRSAPSGVAGIVTGVGAAISGTLFSASSLSGSPKIVGGGATGSGATFDIQAPFAWALQQQAETVDITRETDKHTRATFGPSTCRIAVQFFPIVNGTVLPQLPVGELKALTLTMANSLTYTLNGGSAIVYGADTLHNVHGGISNGRYMIHVNGSMTPNYGAL